MVSNVYFNKMMIIDQSSQDPSRLLAHVVSASESECSHPWKNYFCQPSKLGNLFIDLKAFRKSWMLLLLLLMMMMMMTEFTNLDFSRSKHARGLA
jgi:hypothetical protein